MGLQEGAVRPIIRRSHRKRGRPMDLRFSADELAFRDELRGFIADNLPEDIRERMRLGYSPEKADTIRWQRILNARGWAAYSWPKEHGGPGWTPVQRMMFLEENQLAPAPDMQVFNITMIGPVLIQFGSDEQKRRFLPRAAELDDWWCQGFSEPGAGSDLAALKTAAKREGDQYIVNGQKIWTSTAHMADWCFVLVRTNPQAPKRQEGISFLLIDMKTPGITVRPIISIDGTHHLNEVFFDDVLVPVAMRVGEENKGWDVAKFLLGNERSGIARLGKSKERVAFAKAAAADMRAGGRPLSENHEFRQRIAQLETDIKALEITQLRVLSAQKAGEGKQDPLTAVLKVKGTELLQATSELVMDVGGPLAMPDWAQELAALSNEPELGPVWATEATRSYLMLRAASIYGGTNEIMKNIVSKAVLGL
jgi:alkylation response protein AidB-like acyl-CoA dehydrogenase